MASQAWRLPPSAASRPRPPRWLAGRIARRCGTASTRRNRPHGARSSTDYNCGNCHISDLSGDSIKDVPPLAGTDFLAEWSGKTVKELLDYMSMNMPQDSRGSLGAKTYIDIAAYILKSNQFPAGSAALGSDPDRLAKAVIEREKK